MGRCRHEGIGVGDDRRDAGVGAVFVRRSFFSQRPAGSLFCRRPNQGPGNPSEMTDPSGVGDCLLITENTHSPQGDGTQGFGLPRASGRQRPRGIPGGRIGVAGRGPLTPVARAPSPWAPPSRTKNFSLKLLMGLQPTRKEGKESLCLFDLA